MEIAKLPKLITDYEPRNICNADETGFFCVVNVNQTYLFILKVTNVTMTIVVKIALQFYMVLI
jgi:hypothetical protein